MILIEMPENQYPFNIIHVSLFDCKTDSLGILIRSQYLAI